MPVSFFIQASPPGHGPGPHRHPYAEVFVLHEGSGSFLAGEETIEAEEVAEGYGLPLEAVLEAFTFDFKGVPITAGASKAARDWASCYAKD